MVGLPASASVQGPLCCRKATLHQEQAWGILGGLGILPVQTTPNRGGHCCIRLAKGRAQFFQRGSELAMVREMFQMDDPKAA